MFTGILYTHIFYALGGSEMPNGQNLRPIAARLARAVQMYWTFVQYCVNGMFILEHFSH